ncbi:YbaK/EbsC family protein [Fulvimarina endophytica]|uniref:YbaK/EbsC family protein n=1 Tax=Fulvimarina endophytica TaxID=2293836 RepID=A0A371X013_9HYPH|nr:YbaK/EbsC family protein [Fulvimarina endophytica]RFC62583.1 YbaK/EbsC family protein [Fulvimarina endophytica]
MTETDPKAPHPAVRRVVEDAAAKGVKAKIVHTETTARSAEEAARTLSVSVGEIVKTLVFKGTESGRAYMLLVSGDNRVDEAVVGEALGEGLTRPDAAFVREATGFAIGGVSPFGATGEVTLYMDEDLFRFSSVWAAAGTPHDVFEVVPLQLRSATGARLGPVK